MPFPKKNYSEIPVDTDEIPQSALDISDKARRNPLPWKGQFSPQLVHVLLRNYAKQGDTIFDPFLGSGTVLLESGILNFEASGTEINPAAINLAQTYHFINMEREQRYIILKGIAQKLETLFPLTLFQNGRAKASSSTQKARETRDKLLGLNSSIDYRSETQLVESLITLLDFHKEDLCEQKIFVTWKNLHKHIVHLPYSTKRIQAIHADSRQTNLQPSSIDLVITSPPYINVFNYHQQYRASMEALNWDLLKIAQSEFGSNRKHRGNRFLTVIQFCLDLAQTFEELLRLCKPNARVIFIVGRKSTVNKTPFYNGEIVAEIANQALGFDLHLRQERCFQNRFGQRIYEDILHFSMPEKSQVNTKRYLEFARTIANQTLAEAYVAAPDDKKRYIDIAIQNSEAISPSPIFSLSNNVQ